MQEGMAMSMRVGVVAVLSCLAMWPSVQAASVDPASTALAAEVAGKLLAGDTKTGKEGVAAEVSGAAATLVKTVIKAPVKTAEVVIPATAGAVTTAADSLVTATDLAVTVLETTSKVVGTTVKVAFKIVRGTLSAVLWVAKGVKNAVD
jgi:hypothetical protein